MALQIAVVGCGKIADGHVEEIRKLPGLAQLVACCDREPLMAEQLAARYRIPRHYARFEELLERERPDVVHVTTPPASHLPLAGWALDAGCHVYVEKPLAPTAREAQALVERAVAAKRQLTTGWTYHFDPPALEMRRLVAAGVVGEVVHLDSFYGYQLEGQFGAALLADPDHWVHRLPGQLLQNNLDHLFCRVLDFVDDDAPSVTAIGAVRRQVRFGDSRDRMHDELRALVTGARVTASCTFSSHVRPVANFVRLYGTRNTLHVDYVARTVTLDAAPRLPSALGRLLPPFDQALAYLRAGADNVAAFARSEFHYFSGLQRLIRLFYESIQGGGPPPIPYRDLLRMAALVDQVIAQLQGPRAAP